MPTSCQQTTRIQDRIIKELNAAPDFNTRPPWSEFEVSILKRYYGRKDPALIAKLLKRSKVALQRKAAYLGIRVQKETK
jgi:hypothetical protein